MSLPEGRARLRAVESSARSEQTYSRWRKEYGGLRVDHLKRLKALELEHRRLRSVIADQALALVVVKETAEQAG